MTKDYKTAEDKILRVAEKLPRFGAWDVFRDSDISKLSTVYSQLSRMVNAGKLDRIERGVYSLPEPAKPSVYLSDKHVICQLDVLVEKANKADTVNALLEAGDQLEDVIDYRVDVLAKPNIRVEVVEKITLEN